MGSVWKRLQRVNKRAAKFQFTASYHDLHLETTTKWRPSNLSVVWLRRSRRVPSVPIAWEPDMLNPLLGNISWPVPDNHTISVTLFKDPRTHELEDKEWTFVIEDVTPLGKKRVLASASINMRKYASIESTQQSFTLNLKPVSRKITSATLELTISCVFLREGKATDEDMQSVVSLMSVNNNFDIAPLDDLEDIPDLEISGDMSDDIYDLTHQLEEMTTSLNGCLDVTTPISDPSIYERPTPLAVPDIFPNFENIEDRTKSASPIEDAISLRTDEITPKTEICTDQFKEQSSIQSNNINGQLTNTLTNTSSNDDVVGQISAEEQTTANETIVEDINVTNNYIKRHELPPLELIKIYEPVTTTNTNKVSEKEQIEKSISIVKPIEEVTLKQNTPGQDLLEWCKEITKDYPNVKVTNLTTSWRNGMAFCAVIHYYAPHLIDMSKLSAHEVVGNCRMAFDAAESLGIPRVIEPRDMNLLAVPDKLAVMTYLHQLRAHFTGKQLQLEQIGSTSDESCYVIGNYKSDNLPQKLINFSHLKAQLEHQNSLEEDKFGVDRMQHQQQMSPSGKKDVRNLIFASSKSILGKVLSPTKDKNLINASQRGHLMSSSQDHQSSPSIRVNSDSRADELATPSTLDSQTAHRILTRHLEMSEKAKLMMDKMKISHDNSLKDEGRQQRLRQQARRLIQESRMNGISNGSESPGSPTKSKGDIWTDRTHSSKSTFESNDQLVLELGDFDDATNKKLSPNHRYIERGTTNSSPLQSFSFVIDRIPPKLERKNDKLSFIESELEALEREQEAIDKKASSLENKLRAVMGGNPKTEETEEQLLSQWFTLVNKKNALLRRQMQLNILEQEKDLERKFTMLNQELRAAQSVEDWRKTEAQREKEQLLLEELLAIVNKRDQLVQHLHNQEIAIEDDQEIARELEQVDISAGKDKCSIQ